MGDIRVFFLQSIKVFNLAGNFTVLDNCVRSFNHTEVIDAGVAGQTQDQTDVWTLRSLDGTETAVMRGMNVAHFVAGASAVESARTKGGDRAEMLEFFQSISLLHKLRQLISGEKFSHPSLERLGRNKLHRQSNIGIDSGHPILDISLNLGHTDTNFLLEEFPHQTHSSRTQVINIIFHRAGSGIEMNNMRDNQDKIREREGATFNLFGGFFDAKTVVEPKTADAG